jgi:hypothetical protein
MAPSSVGGKRPSAAVDLTHNSQREVGSIPATILLYECCVLKGLLIHKKLCIGCKLGISSLSDGLINCAESPLP